MFGKIELLVTNSAEKASFYKDVLIRNGIKYTDKCKSSSSASIMRTNGRKGRVGEDMTSSFLYYVYVKKEDYDTAKNAIYEAQRNT